MYLKIIALSLLVWSFSASAALFTVPSGSYPDVQSAITAALAAPGTDEIRVRSGTYIENLNIEMDGVGNVLEISGGWNAGFTTMSDDPSTIDGNDAGRVVEIYLQSGDSLTLKNFRFRDGLASRAAGVDATVENGGSLEITDCEIVDNIAADDRASAGGLSLFAYGTGEIALTDSLVSGNQVNCSGTVDCREGGMNFTLNETAIGTVKRNLFINNSVTIATGSAFSGGAKIDAFGSSTLTVEDNEFIGNTTSGTSSSGTGIGLGVSGSGVKTVRRNHLTGNTATLPEGQSSPQLALSNFGSGIDILSDSVIVNSNMRGVSVTVSGDAGPTVHVVNLTVADNDATGVSMNVFGDTGTLSLSNTISVDNGTNSQLGGTVSTSNNLIGGTAGFVNSAVGNYSLASNSDAVNAGTNTPDGGLGPTDIDGNSRIFQGTVDQGAYEFTSDIMFLDGFEADES